MKKFDEHIFQMGWFNHQLEKLIARKSQESSHEKACTLENGTAGTVEPKVIEVWFR